MSSMAIIRFGVIGAVGVGFSWLIGLNGAQMQNIPVLAICAVIAFGINWLVFIPSYLSHSEKYFDLTGAITYACVVLAALILSGTQDVLKMIVGAMVIVWCTRLGTMLFRRILSDGEDKRFRKIKTDFTLMLQVWTLQGMWVTLTAACALVLMTTKAPLQLDIFFVSGALIWAIGFAVEVVADAQKGAFRANPENRGRFITTGLWSWSQHPNYFGEILLWSGIAIMSIPVLEGFGWMALISPVFVYLLLTRVSGISMLDKQAKARWGSEEAYNEYIAKTSVLVPRPPK